MPTCLWAFSLRDIVLTDFSMWLWHMDSPEAKCLQWQLAGKGTKTSCDMVVSWLGQRIRDREQILAISPSRNWNCCNRRTRFVMIWKHFCLILFTGTRIQTDSVMHPRSSSRGRYLCLIYSYSYSHVARVYLFQHSKQNMQLQHNKFNKARQSEGRL